MRFEALVDEELSRTRSQRQLTFTDNRSGGTAAPLGVVDKSGIPIGPGSVAKAFDVLRASAPERGIHRVSARRSRSAHRWRRPTALADANRRREQRGDRATLDASSPRCPPKAAALDGHVGIRHVTIEERMGRIYLVNREPPRL